MGSECKELIKCTGKGFYGRLAVETKSYVCLREEGGKYLSFYIYLPPSRLLSYVNDHVTPYE